jgi:flavodoxin
MEKMKTAIIYTSKHGTTAKVAQMIAGRLSVAVNSKKNSIFAA